jgi:hypothetical protein
MSTLIDDLQLAKHSQPKSGKQHLPRILPLRTTTPTQRLFYLDQKTPE